MPAITIGMPVFNGAQFLDAALGALVAQDFSDVEILVADNASTDDTREIVERFADLDSRIRLLPSNVNRGIAWNYNRLLTAANGTYFMWHAADDVMRPGHLRRCYDALVARPDAVVAFTRVVLIDSLGVVTGERDDEALDMDDVSPSRRLATFLVRETFQAIGYGALFATTTLRRLGGLPPMVSGDELLAVRMALLGPWLALPEQLFEERVHDGQMTKTLGADPVVQARVYDPTRHPRVAFPMWRLLASMVGTALGAPIPAAERARAVGVLGRRWVVPGWRRLAFDVKRNVIHLARGSYRGAYHFDVAG